MARGSQAWNSSSVIGRSFTSSTLEESSRTALEPEVAECGGRQPDEEQGDAKDHEGERPILLEPESLSHELGVLMPVNDRVDAGENHRDAEHDLCAGRDDVRLRRLHADH